jgi:16S rRNA (guanine527-N7)-methyltransferase
LFHVKQPLSADAFRLLTGSDAAATARLACHLDLLRRWQQRINLVGASTLADPWRRHVLDSAQLAPRLPPARPPWQPQVVDIGAGAGFPGLVLAMLSQADVVLVDSDARKCAFLHEAARLTATRVRIENRRAETLPPGIADVVVARALAPLPKLLAIAYPLLRQGGLCLLLKGGGVEAELTAAREEWTMRVCSSPSLSDPSGVVLTVTDLAPRDDR